MRNKTAEKGEGKLFSDVISNTSTPWLLDKILQVQITSAELYYMRLEALWILLNLATIKDQDEISTLYASSFDQDDEPMQSATNQLSDCNTGKSALLTHINGILVEIAKGDYADTTTLNLVIQTLSNMVAMSDYHLKLL